MTTDTCLVIGNGPSLANIPLDFIRRYPTFGSNRIYLLFQPDYYCAINPLIVEQFRPQIAQIKGKVFICAKLAHLVPGCIPLKSVHRRIFSMKPLEEVYEGYTVTYVLMQLAYYYGYKRVGLLGVDHLYHDIVGAPNEEKVKTVEDRNHFSPDYFPIGTRRHNPDLAKSEDAYRLARGVFEGTGRQIVNLTPGSALDVFTREDWQSWL